MPITELRVQTLSRANEENQTNLQNFVLAAGLCTTERQTSTSTQTR
jgi:hypothetical protein